MKYIPKLSNNNLWRGSVGLFVLGIILPMFSFQKLLVLNETYSLLSGVFELLKEGEAILSLVVLSFSIILPAYKLYLSKRIIDGRVTDSEEALTLIRRLAIAGKWSMADVFVVSIIAATVKLGVFANVTVHVGLFVFGLAVLSSMWLTHRLMSGYALRPANEET
ncbi:hypothetical protein BZG04_01385 [Salinivibrio kushneri]|uniref:paraquat-inducible protein A n=1 Tax=Salinivibrio kushneri TaxID=1908198 RepID=UPI0009893A89|nr:paraquat-inducible protein A [Salinivibrio kushneri]OOE33500.1 hypothetical protein BZG05_10735 [Salinivibrio kushneri]OOE37835.1 hypothetical protein BZG04_01385 [Salinivibrio kushneri]